MSKTVEFFTPEGAVKEYSLFSARLPAFLQAFPKQEGYRVVITTADMLTYKPALMELYKAAIAAGKSPKELDLPALPSGDVIVFKASLMKDDLEIESATSLQMITAYKDWEKGETAARQRLIAALGFGGDCFDSDELSSIQEQGHKVVTKGTTPTKEVAKAKPKAKPKKEAEPKPEAQVEEQAEVEAEPASELNVETQPEVEAVVETVETNEVEVEVEVEEIPARLIRQIEHQARLKNKPVPQVSTVKEAKSALKALMQS